MKLIVKTEPAATISIITNPAYNPYEVADLIYNPQTLGIAVKPEITIERETRICLWNIINKAFSNFHFVSEADVTNKGRTVVRTITEGGVKDALHCLENIDRAQLSIVENALLVGVIRVATTARYNKFNLVFIFEDNNEL